jgi:hypothetical protein
VLSEITHENFFHILFTLHVAFTSHHLIVAMILSSSSEDRTFDDLNDLLRFINEHAGPEGYAVVLKRIKKFKLGVKSKVWIICDRGRKSHECTRQNRRHDDSRHMKCSFSIIVKLVDENSDS